MTQHCTSMRSLPFYLFPRPTHAASLLAVLYILFITFLHPSDVDGMRVFKSWDTRPKCEKIQRPLWPFAYYKNEPVEHKGRVTSNFQNLGHTCQVKGTAAKCHRCETFRCNGHSEDGTCPLQLQGVDKNLMPINVPTNSDTPWAVNGAHRNDFGGIGTWVCTMLSGGECVALRDRGREASGRPRGPRSQLRKSGIPQRECGRWRLLRYQEPPVCGG